MEVPKPLCIRRERFECLNASLAVAEARVEVLAVLAFDPDRVEIEGSTGKMERRALQPIERNLQRLVVGAKGPALGLEDADQEDVGR